MATHYCPQGNQPRLVATEGKVSQKIEFVFRDATNLTHPEDSHQVYLAFDIESRNNVARHEHYAGEGRLESSSMSLVRIDAK